MPIRNILNGTAAAVVLSAAGLCHAAYPDRPVRLVIPFAPGGSTDVVARQIAPKLQSVLGQPVIIDNRGGGGGVIANEFVAKSPPDGYTLIMTTNSHTANPAIHRNLPYNTRTDFESVFMVADSPGLLVANAKFAPDNFKEFIERARTANPRFTYGTAGVGTFPHLTMELLKDRAGIDLVHVPYRGAGPAMTDLLGGVYDVKVDAYATAGQYVETGKLKAYAVTSKERIAQLPDVPTVAEMGYPGFESTFWMAILAPAGTPKDVIEILDKAFTTTLQDKQIADSLYARGVRVIAKPAAAVDELIDRELKLWPPIVQKANITSD